MDDEDYLFAIQLQEQFDFEASTQTHGDRDGFGQSHGDGNGFEQSSGKKQTFESSSRTVIPYSRPPEKPLSLVDESWETLDPSPDVRAMFLEFNAALFWGKLSGVEVKWSPKMTLCAGVCSYEGRGGLCSIRLSEPLLKLRPRRDLVQTLLHEMIHALLFVTQNNRDRDGHGPEFCKHMTRINDATGTKITVYHTFHDEVDLYRQHWWRCNGPCKDRKPYFGYVKRSMNRPPQPADNWWGDHQRSCGGTYTKVKEPEGNEKKKKTTQGDGSKGKKTTNQKPSDQKPSVKMESPKKKTASGLQDIRNVIPFSGQGFILGGRSQPPPVSPPKPALPLPSPPTREDRSPGWSLLKGGATGGGRGPTKKKSVSNTKVFININGSPVRINKPGSQSTKTDGFKGKQSSVQDLFKTRGLKTSPNTASSSTVSKPPDETQGASTSSTIRGSDFIKRPKNTTSATNMTGASTASSSTVSKPPDDIRGGSNFQPKNTTSASNMTGATTTASSSSSGENPASSGPSGSRKRTSAHIFDFFDKTMSSSSKRSREDGEGASAAAASSSSPSSSPFPSPAAQPSLGAPSASLTVSCPVCRAQVPEAKINQHLDSCLSGF